MVHQYKLGGYNIVIDACSGSVHAVDDVAYDVIADFKSKSENELVCAILKKYKDRPDVTESEVKSCVADVAALEKAGKLFAPDSFERLAGALKKKNGDVIKALCLHVAHTCNLNCSYCFASQGKYHGERAIMPFEAGRRALDFLIERSGTRRNLEVDFFGGEPLMNWEVCKRLVAYARAQEKRTGKRFRFTLTTNGMLVDDDVIAFSNREMNNVVMSLDGRKEVHDRFRRDYAGNGSWERIVPKFQRFAEARGGREYYIRGTFTHANPDFMEDIFEMLRLGFTRLSMEPVVCARDDPSALTEEDKPIIFRQYELLAQEMIRRRREDRPFVFYHYMLDLKGGPCIYKRLSGCGSGTEYMAVTPRGELYPCHQFVGEKKFRLGNIYDGVTRPEIREEFRNCNVCARPECAGCWARLWCAGGCTANAYHASGTIRGIYGYGCDLFRKRLECALMVKVSEELDREKGGNIHGHADL